MYSIVARLGILLLAVVAMVAVGWPSDAWLERFWIPPDFPLGYRVWFWALHLGNMAAVISVVIAVMVAVRKEVDASAFPLAVSLACIALLWGVWTVPDLLVDRHYWSVILVFWVFFGTGLFNFALRYPYRYREDELLQLVSRNHRRKAKFVSDHIAPSVVGVYRIARWLDRLHRRALLIVFGPSGLKRLRRLDTYGNFPVVNVLIVRGLLRLWWISAVASLIAVACILLQISEFIDALVASFGALYAFALITGAVFTFALGFARADSVGQANALWVFAGLVLGGMFAFVIFYVSLLAPIGPGLKLGAALLGLLSGWMIFTVCLVPALLMRGALGSGLIIRGSMFVGLFGVILAFVFAVVENLITLLISDFVDLPDGTGLVVSGGVAAMMFAPLWKRVNRWLESFVDVEGTE